MPEEMVEAAEALAALDEAQDPAELTQDIETHGETQDEAAEAAADEKPTPVVEPPGSGDPTPETEPVVAATTPTAARGVLRK